MARPRKPRPGAADPLIDALAASVAMLRRARPRPRVAVAVSGGADSVALLDALVAMAGQGAADPPVAVLTVHHGLSAQADAWVACARAHAERLGIAHDAARVEPRRGDPRGLEGAARDARYAALARLCALHGADVLATAHHLDDVAETVLLQALRGAGLAGLAAMPALRPLGPAAGMVGAAGATPLLLWRPLLDVPRASLRERVERLGLAHGEDPSNADTRFARNALRAVVLPAIERHFPAYRITLARLARHAAQAEALAAEAAAIDLERVAETHPALGDALRLGRWLALPTERRARVLRAWLARAGLRAPSTARLAEMQRQLERAAPDAAVLLTHQHRQVRRWRDWIVLDASPPVPAPPPQALAVRWSGQPRIELPELGGAILVEPERRPQAPGVAPSRLAAGPLVLRPRRGRERIALAPGAPSRTLKNVFQERGVPSWQRPRLPIAYLGERLLWVAGIGFDARVADREGERLALRWAPAEAP